jgi:GNAT superfamily N-acetyltransferase
MVDTTLGIIPSGNEESSHARNPTQSMAFLFVSSAKQIVGFLLAERITSKTDKISKAKRVLDDNKKEMSERNYVPVMYDLDENIQSKVCTGISRIWVRSDYQRKGIGSRLVEAMRKHFVGYHILSPEEFAFSHTTPNGTDFAISYMAKQFKRMEFFAYAPELGRELSINSIDKTNDRLRH